MVLILRFLELKKCLYFIFYSSRSHAIFVITVECSEDGLDGKNHIRVGKLNLVDLAGSERQVSFSNISTVYDI